MKLTDFDPSQYSDENSFYKALVRRASEIKAYRTIEGNIIWDNHWYGIVRIFSTSATSGTVEVVNHSIGKESIVKVSNDTVTIKDVVDSSKYELKQIDLTITQTMINNGYFVLNNYINVNNSIYANVISIHSSITVSGIQLQKYNNSGTMVTQFIVICNLSGRTAGEVLHFEALVIYA